MYSINSLANLPANRPTNNNLSSYLLVICMSSSERLPDEFDLVRTETKGISKKSTFNKDMQLHPDVLNNLDQISEGDFLKVTNKVGDMSLSTYGRVEPRTEETHKKGMAEDEVALGSTGRDAICASAGEDVVQVDYVDFSETSKQRAILNKFIGVRVAVGRARKAISTDAGYRICRLREDVKQTIGIEWGDHVVIQSPEARVTGIKALPITSHQRDIIENRQNSEDYRSSIENTDLREHINPGRENLPKIHIAYSTRQALGITAKPHSGVHQPLKIHRDVRYVSHRILHDLTIPFLLALIASFIGLELPLFAVVGLLAVGFTLLLLSTYLESRQALR